ncbi:MAG TPA: triose-phosphate isomerase family protein [Candidatus Nanoarchaeia archaeon]
MDRNLIIVANWKATKTIKETIEWAKRAKTELERADWAEIVVCPPFVSLPTAVSLFEGTKIKVGVQDISKFKKGAYTGEVTVEMLDGLADYAIVGHSERRRYFGETEDDIIQKVEALLEFKITPILCVSDLTQLDSYLARGKEIIENAEKVVFVDEPPNAISGGGAYHPDTPENASLNSGKISEKIGKKVKTLYGGSINPENAHLFFSQKNIDGGLVGQASTEVDTFLKIILSIKPGRAG